MQWERKKPVWPRVAALGLLLVLVLAAPQSWQSDESLSALPPAAVDITAINATAINATATGTAPIETAPSVREALPVRKTIDHHALAQVRDVVLGALDQSPGASDTETSGARPRVQVASEQDRLAMVIRRRPTSQTATRPTPRPTTPPRAAQVTPSALSRQEAANFAALLLEAARPSQATRPDTRPDAQLAMRTSVPAVAPVITPTPSRPSAARSSTVTRSSTTAPPRVAVPTPVATPPAAPTVTPAPPSVAAAPLLQHPPEALLQQLQSFSAGAPGSAWADQVLVQIGQLTDALPAQQQDAPRTLAALKILHATGLTAAQEQAISGFHNDWLQCVQGLGRRLPLWQLLLDSQQPQVVGGVTTVPELLPSLRAVAELLADDDQGAEWSAYLQLDSIATAISEGTESPLLVRAQLSQEVLSRMSDPRLTAAQRAFLATEPLVALQQTLRPWAAGRVDLKTLAVLLERYESDHELRYAEVIAQLQQRLKWSEIPAMQAFAADLQTHYRQANMRLALSDQLLNRMLPKQKPIITPVNDRIAGAKVRGRARTTTQLRIQFVPDPQAWHFGLEALGSVYSDTSSDTWPARIRNAAKLKYQARKEISLDAQGLHVQPTQAAAQGRNELLGVDSQLDPIPFLGSMLRDLARKKHTKSRPQALSQAKAKVVRQAKSRMDSTLDEKLTTLETKFRDQVLAPIEKLALLAEPLDIHTTPQRAVMQLRLANLGQLAAHTARPLAPSDSVLSLQMHESGLNNAMMGLGLDGRRMTTYQLFQAISERLGRPDATPAADMPRNAIIEFASRDAVRVRCDGDQLELILGVKELAHRRDKIKNFQIHVHFRPQLEGLQVTLVREGSLQFSGHRLKTGPRVVLHSVLGKVLEKGQAIALVHPSVLEDPRLANFMITQLVIEDGWIGLALGPAHARRIAWRTSTPELLQTPLVR